MQQQQSIIFLLFITIIYATQINYFDSQLFEENPTDESFYDGMIKRSAGPINNYKLIIDPHTIIDNISSDALKYDMTEDYIIGQKSVFYLQAYNINSQNDVLCSDRDSGIATFYMPITTTSGK
ncbi:unnamed protein product [Rotaria sp. Silwood2]|nr:unnamed protein product [Rotaria sp. Silwood2]CAF3910924.1 unnamed protein product [Rotaria sp. Silwood2]CAF3927178.1 unnamed protein product [Rotaria sp. Silwood2]CAF4264008.1 unnamed protein product [Rotaria sp. Silwood2]